MYADSDCVFFKAHIGLLPGELDGTEQQINIRTYRLNWPRNRFIEPSDILRKQYILLKKESLLYVIKSPLFCY